MGAHSINILVMHKFQGVFMYLIKNLCQKTSHCLKRVWELMPLRSLWEVWALLNILIIFVLVIESIWLPDINDNLSRTLLNLYLGNLTNCQPETK